MELLRRVRWGNVARALAVLAAAALIVAWPRLRAEPPVVPDGAPPASVVEPRVEEPPPRVEPRETVQRPRAKSRPRPRRARRAEPRRSPRRVPRPARPPAPESRSPVGASGSPPQAPAVASGAPEFGFE